MATATREPALKRQEIEQHKHAVEERADRVVVARVLITRLSSCPEA